MIFDERQIRFLYREGFKSISDVLQIEMKELEKLVRNTNDALEEHEVEALRDFRFWHHQWKRDDGMNILEAFSEQVWE